MIRCKASLIVFLLAVGRGAATTHELWQHASPEDLGLTGESLEATSTADQTEELWASVPEDPAPPVEDVDGLDDSELHENSLMLQRIQADTASLLLRKQAAEKETGELDRSLRQVTKEMGDYNTALQELTEELTHNLESDTPRLITEQTLLDDVLAMEAELRELEAAAPAKPAADEHRAASEEMAKLQRAMSLASASAERVSRLRELEEQNRKLTERSRNLTERNAQLKQAAQLAANPLGYIFQQVQDEFTKRQRSAAQALAEPHHLHEKSVQDESTMGHRGAAQALAESHDLREKSIQCGSLLRAARDEISKQESLHEQLQSGIQKLRSGVPERQLDDTIEMFFAQRQQLINATTAFQHKEREILRRLGSIVDPLKALQAVPAERPRGSVFLARGPREPGPRGSPGDLQHIGGVLRELHEGLSQVQGHRRAAVGTLRDEASSLLSMA